ncbi:hypothetical protein PUN28_018795 [Cardiocondyla obscurior]|uniref:Uncharacterized protein n=1 Tax=Cardiocondyla obscurior TaxID=286306 RepID=A0AAW2EFX9_9HYME
MISIKRQLKYNRILLLSIGLWPYQQSKFVQLQLILFFGVLISCIVSQFTVFVFTKCTVDTAIKVLSAALYVAMCTIQYNSFRINIHIVKQLLDELDHIFKELTDENEITILKEYGKTAERFTIIIMSKSILLLILTHSNVIFGYDDKSNKLYGYFLNIFSD